ncbi:hypothetical protein RF11_10359 [Thelohanellus kitauei]|uniref:Uncharacterized protein n=1 Tax=Thelohanellus kitauei TaxID=669202 RepID=A0A0C2MDM6_THEKT|nr:hypothetical protein RF11_10359 [Thelohanellus kitauei]
MDRHSEVDVTSVGVEIYDTILQKKFYFDNKTPFYQYLKRFDRRYATFTRSLAIELMHDKSQNATLEISDIYACANDLHYIEPPKPKYMTYADPGYSTKSPLAEYEKRLKQLAEWSKTPTVDNAAHQTHASSSQKDTTGQYIKFSTEESEISTFPYTENFESSIEMFKLTTHKPTENTEVLTSTSQIHTFKTSVTNANFQRDTKTTTHQPSEDTISSTESSRRPTVKTSVGIEDSAQASSTTTQLTSIITESSTQQFRTHKAKIFERTVSSTQLPQISTDQPSEVTETFTSELLRNTTKSNQTIDFSKNGRPTNVFGNIVIASLIILIVVGSAYKIWFKRFHVRGWFHYNNHQELYM